MDTAPAEVVEAKARQREGFDATEGTKGRGQLKSRELCDKDKPVALIVRSLLLVLPGDVLDGKGQKSCITRTANRPCRWVDALTEMPARRVLIAVCSATRKRICVVGCVPGGRRRSARGSRKEAWASEASDGSLYVGHPLLQVVEAASEFVLQRVDFAVQRLNQAYKLANLFLVHDVGVFAGCV
jgi:hypothetical protein